MKNVPSERRTIIDNMKQKVFRHRMMTIIYILFTPVILFIMISMLPIPTIFDIILTSTIVIILAYRVYSEYKSDKLIYTAFITTDDDDIDEDK